MGVMADGPGTFTAAHDFERDGWDIGIGFVALDRNPLELSPVWIVVVDCVMLHGPVVPKHHRVWRPLMTVLIFRNFSLMKE